jgi:hypothetical protein
MLVFAAVTVTHTRESEIRKIRDFHARSTNIRATVPFLWKQYVTLWHETDVSASKI